MGVVLIAKGEDFSGIKVGRIGIDTSIQSGLEALFEFRADSEIAIDNQGANGIDGDIVGAPTINTNNMITTPGNYVDLRFVPTGNHTVALVVHVRATSDAGFPAAAVTVSPTTTGSEYFAQRADIRFEATSHIGAAYDRIIAPALAKPGTVSPELYLATLESGAGCTLYHPRTGVSAFGALSVGATFDYPAPPTYKVAHNLVGVSETVYAYAYWSRVLSVAEINTFYNEIRSYYSPKGIVL